MIRFFRVLCFSGTPEPTQLLSACLHGNRTRLETNAEQWSQLLKTLAELIEWVTGKADQVKKLQPIGGDIASVAEQNEEHKVCNEDSNW